MFTSTPIQGAIDTKTATRRAWKQLATPATVMETGLYNLTQSETPLLIHNGTSETRKVTMARIEDPSLAPGGRYSTGCAKSVKQLPKPQQATAVLIQTLPFCIDAEGERGCFRNASMAPARQQFSYSIRLIDFFWPASRAVNGFCTIKPAATTERVKSSAMGVIWYSRTSIGF